MVLDELVIRAPLINTGEAVVFTHIDYGTAFKDGYYVSEFKFAGKNYLHEVPVSFSIGDRYGDALEFLKGLGIDMRSPDFSIVGIK